MRRRGAFREVSGFSAVDIIERGRSTQVIHFEVSHKAGAGCLVSAIYASPYATFQTLLWDELRDVKSRCNIPWCLVGDFNSLLSAADKSGVRHLILLEHCRSLSVLITVACWSWGFWVRDTLGLEVDWERDLIGVWRRQCGNVRSQNLWCVICRDLDQTTARSYFAFLDLSVQREKIIRLGSLCPG
ncbi:hypothetical protein LINPERHAP2_LOCUS4601 [Linum perenne]